MRLGVSVPTARPDRLPAHRGHAGRQRARHRAGRASTAPWFFDAIGRGFMLPDPLIGASVAAAVTTRIEIGTGVLQVPLRNPVELAHRILTAHLVCRGRLLLGVGAGSTPGDFEALGLDFTQRMRTLEESLATMRKLWRGEKVGAADLTPWPARLGARGADRQLEGRALDPAGGPGVRRLDRLGGQDQPADADRGDRPLSRRGRQARDRDQHRGGSRRAHRAAAGRPRRSTCAALPTRRPGGCSRCAIWASTTRSWCSRRRPRRASPPRGRSCAEPMTHTADVVVIGGGVNGVSIAYALAGRGVRVVLVEKGALASGASGRSSALVRMHYTNEWDARLAWASFPVFRNWRRADGRPAGLHPHRLRQRGGPRPRGEPAAQRGDAPGDRCADTRDHARTSCASSNPTPMSMTWARRPTSPRAATRSGRDGRGLPPSRGRAGRAHHASGPR